jgi:hypothetical protein
MGWTINRMDIAQLKVGTLTTTGVGTAVGGLTTSTKGDGVHNVTTVTIPSGVCCL